jgi:hypothetical protein
MFIRIKNFLVHLLLFPIALILLFEEWGWVPLAAFFNNLAKTITLWRKGEKFVEQLSPRWSLIVLLVPMLTLLPMKFLGLYFIELGHVTSGVGVFLFSKVCGTAFFARLFNLTKPNLLKLGWFGRIYPRWIDWKNSVLQMVRSTWPWRFAYQLKVKASEMIHRP